MYLPTSTNLQTISFKGFFTAVFLLTSLLSTTVLAETFEDGREAYQAKDYERAFAIMKPLAEDGNSQAQVSLGIMYEYGQGVEKNHGEAIKWYTLAAKQGVPEVQHDLGVRYFQGGMGVKQDYKEAAYWWEQAANAGVADSQFNLGLMHYRGIGMPKDFTKAAELFRKAADQGHAHAEYSLAVMNAFGQGMEINYAEALKLFKESADQGVPQAQFNLGVFYENGYGLDKNLETAREWYQLAASQGLEEAKQKLVELAKIKPSIEPDKNEQPAEPAEQPKSEEKIAKTDLVAPKPSKTAPPVPAAKTEIKKAEPVTTPDPEPVNSDTNSGLRGDKWVLQQQPSVYTLQISSTLQEKDAIKLIKDYHFEKNAAYFRVVINDTTRYTTIYGIFDSYDEAQAAIKKLPESLQKNKPWARNIGQLQKLIQER